MRRIWRSVAIIAACLGWLANSAARAGVVSVTLEAKEGTTVFGGVPIKTIVYNHTFAGPVLRVRPGDTLLVHLRNRLTEPTNLHFHGIQTSPLGNGDNVHISVPAGGEQDYAVKIPRDQPPGTYWYHAHPHGLAERQVGLGLSGTLIVEGFRDRIPGLGNVREQVLAIKILEIDDSDDPTVNNEWHGVLPTINGAIAIEVRMRPGETVLWHLSNQSANLIAHLALAGHRFTIIGRDGSALASPIETEVLDIDPAGRMEVLVTGGAPGVHALVVRNVLTGQGVRPLRHRTIGHITVAGAPAPPASPVLPRAADLSRLKVSGTRLFSFTQSSGGEKFFMNDQLFDMDRLDTRVMLGAVEDWTIRNDSDDMHVFHIHQLPFQVMAINHQPVAANGLLDTVRVPERGSVTIRLAFTNPAIVGRFMYHCHVLKHEDKGMMQTIEVVNPQAPASPPPKHTH